MDINRKFKEFHSFYQYNNVKPLIETVVRNLQLRHLINNEASRSVEQDICFVLSQMTDLCVIFDIGVVFNQNIIITSI